MIFRTEIRKGVKDNDAGQLTFNIKLESLEPEVKPSADPYSKNLDVEISSFQAIRDSFVIQRNDLTRVGELLLGALSDWVIYTNEAKWKLIGYDGPQVPRYPWKEKYEMPHKPLWS